MTKTLVLFFLIAGIISSYAQTNDSSLDSLINQALQVSPKLKMLNEKYYASESRIEINSNLPDPMLTSLYSRTLRAKA